MHIHVSLVDTHGNNLFAGDPMAPLFRQAIGGLSASMPDFMAVWAQSANAYRRYVPESYVPMSAHWGFNNRTVALRVPHCATPPATRIEHRVLRRRCEPVPGRCRRSSLASATASSTGSIRGSMRRAMPKSSMAPRFRRPGVNALEKFRSSEIVRDAFGAGFQDVYYRLKETERISFERIVTSLDYEWYAQVA